MKKTLVINFVIALLIIGIVNATSWVQVTSPTTADLRNVVSLSTGYAYGISDAGANCYLYNKVNWSEINCAEDILSMTSFHLQTNYDLYKLTNGQVIMIYHNNTNWYKIVTYNPQINEYYGAWNSTSNFTGTSVCYYDDNACYFHLLNGSIYNIYPSYTGEQYAYNVSTAITWQNKFPMLATTGATGLYEHNGVSWVYRGFSAMASATHGIYRSSGYRAQQSSNKVYFYNTTSGLYDLVANSTGSCTTAMSFATSNGFRIVDMGSKIGFIDSTRNGFEMIDWLDTNNCDYTAGIFTDDANSFDYDTTSHIGWVFTGAGRIYMYDASIGGDVYSLTSSVQYNPVVYGTTTNFYATPSSPTGQTSTINIAFYNSTGDWVYGWSWLNAPSGITQNNDVSSIAWLNIPIGVYTVTVNSTEGMSGVTAKATNITWNVTRTQNYTTINYTLPEYDWTNTLGLYNLFGIDKFSNDIIYGFGVNSTDAIIFTMDANNPLNIVTNYYVIPDTNRTAYLNYLNSISVYDQSLYVATDDELYLLNTTGTGRANDLVFQDNIAMNGRDYVTDVTAVNNIFSWICQKGYTSDNARLYNRTSNDLDTAIGENPCESIEYDSDRDLLYIHKGTNGLQIYNQSNQSLMSSIATYSLPPDASHDLETYYNNYLFVITHQNTMRKYDLTDSTSPVLIDECRTDGYIYSLEAINQDEIIIGTSSGIEICDFNNTELYESANNYYFSKLLNSETELPYEITTVNTNKLGVAFGNGIKFYNYFRNNVKTIPNSVPVINNLTISNIEPCINQLITITINAQDNEDDDITYDWSCEGTKYTMTNHYLYNTFTCNYANTGIRSIIALATDGITGHIDQAYSQTISVYNCTANYTIFLHITDCRSGLDLGDSVVTLDDGTTGTTDSNGQINFEVTTNRGYNLSFSKAGYFDKNIDGIYPSGFGNVCLEPINDEEGNPLTTLTVIVKNESDNTINGALVSITDTFTGSNDYGVTDSNGIAILSDTITGTNLLLSANLENSGYATTTSRISLTTGEQKTITIILLRVQPEGYDTYEITPRNCKDLIPGILLCGNLSTTGAGNNCHNDSQCISGDCVKANTDTNGTCSNFNWTYCDAHGLGRGNGCFILANLRGGTGAIADSIFGPFFFLFVIALLLIIVFVMARKNK